MLPGPFHKNRPPARHALIGPRGGSKLDGRSQGRWNALKSLRSFLLEVVIAPSGGFCWGVERAIQIADEVANTMANRPGVQVRTFGPLVHNKEALRGVERKGVYSNMDVEGLQQDDVVVLRAH